MEGQFADGGDAAGNRNRSDAGPAEAAVAYLCDFDPAPGRRDNDISRRTVVIGDGVALDVQPVGAGCVTGDELDRIRGLLRLVPALEFELDLIGFVSFACRRSAIVMGLLALR